MNPSMVPLLIQSSDVPAVARRALLAARDAAPGERAPYLETAARSLYREVGLDCDDARALVGLPDAGACG